MREQLKQIIREYYLLHILKDGYTEENETLVVDRILKLFKDNRNIIQGEELYNNIKKGFEIMKRDTSNIPKPIQPTLAMSYGIQPVYDKGEEE